MFLVKSYRVNLTVTIHQKPNMGVWYECPNPRKTSVGDHMLLDTGT